jgi:hypothetical protein
MLEINIPAAIFLLSVIYAMIRYGTYLDNKKREEKEEKKSKDPIYSAPAA